MALNLELINNNINLWDKFQVFLTGKDFDIEVIRKAYTLAEKIHEDQKRLNGDDYITHPVWVAKIIAQLNLGQEAILAAMLHDTIETGLINAEQLSKTFGDEVALLVDGLTEVKKKTKGVEVDKNNVDLFRKFLFSSVNDVRILIIRIIEKLHNGFTVEALPKDKQIRYATQVFSIYGPISEYVGLHYFKRLIEDIAFRILYPKDAEKIIKIFKEKSKDEIKALALVKESINNMLKINNIGDCLIEGRIKSLYSTYLKTVRKGEEGIKDRVGIRILTSDVADCYTILGLLHSTYKYLPDEFDDYISSPKPNGYRSIQTTLFWKDKLTVEVQIKTKEMHDFNEFGPASHIAYKLGREVDVSSGMEWVRDLIKWQTNDNNTKNYQIQVLKNYIYVFTPKGDTIQMPKDSTALDFAYRIHSYIGDHCKGIKINNKMAKINTVLKTGDMVEILVSKKNNVNKAWLDFVKTDFAKEKIRHAVFIQKF